MLNDLLAKNQSSDKLYVEDVFSTWLYTGTGASQTITNGVNLAGKGGLVWIKDRSNAADHVVQDTVRGNTKILNTNSTAAEDTASAGTNVTSFNSTGFSLGTNYSNINTNGQTYASWTFRKAPKFFDVVTYTGTGSTQAINHNLGSVPGMIIIKSRSIADGWAGYHRSLGATKYIWLQLSNAAATSTNFWNNTDPTSTQFTVQTNTAVNQSGATYVAYLFAHDAGGFGADGSQNVISCGSFTSNNTVQSITLGYEPQFVIVKSSNQAQGWWVFDNMRDMSQTSDKYLVANTTAAEATFSTLIRPTATGFTWDGPYAGDNGTSYIYMAIRRGPMRTPTSGTSVFSPIARTGNGTTTNITTGFVTDLAVGTKRATAGGNYPTFIDRLRGNSVFMFSDSTTTETTDSSLISSLANNTGYVVGADSTGYGYFNESGVSLVSWNFARAPGFFDVVCYTGTGSGRTVSHNLGVAPELIILKKRNTTGGWPVYSASLTTSENLNLNQTAAANTSTPTNLYWNDTAPTTSVFSLGPTSVVNGSGDTFVAYLFATCPGVSKVGSYTGTGTTLQINCGFTNGARFVLIKRTDSTGDWYVYDSARGIVAGNDPYLLLNSTAAEVTNTDYVDAYSAGFELSSTAPAALNANGGTYIYLAIA